MTSIDMDEYGSQRISLRHLALVGGVLLLVIAASLFIRQHVQRSVAEHEGEWSFDLEFRPEWMPREFKGELANLSLLPQEVQLRTATWRKDLLKALEGNSWIQSVSHLTRVGTEVNFVASFHRPLVAIRHGNGFLLLDGQGRIIDRQPGAELSSAWGIPFFQTSDPRVLPEQCYPGQRLIHIEITEMMSLVRELWKHGVIETWASRIPEITVAPGARGREWYLQLSKPVKVKWGYAPGSEQVSVVDVEQKIANFEQVMLRWKDLRDPIITVNSGSARISD